MASLSHMYNPFPQLTDAVTAFSDSEGARLNVSGRVAAGVARVPDVRDVVGDGGAAGGG